MEMSLFLSVIFILLHQEDQDGLVDLLDFCFFGVHKRDEQDND